MLKTVLLATGALGLLAGLLFIGQGTGVFPYPRQSFMVSEMPWAYRGAGLAVVSAAALVVGWRMPARR
jgi:membrane protein implicated in regulation of membrane protease activity